jgi:hypothetical protein
MIRRTALLILLPMLPACTSDPMDRAGSVRASGVNEANLHAMLVDPDHARRGIGAVGAPGAAAAIAVDDLLSGKRQPLPEWFTTLGSD